MPRDFYYGTDEELSHSALTFSTAISSDPAFYGVSQLQADQFAALCQDYREKYKLATLPATRTTTAVLKKNESRKALMLSAKLLSRIIVANPDVSSAGRLEIGLYDRAASMKVHEPDEAPAVWFISARERVATIRVSERLTISNGKPKSIIGASVFVFAGEEPPQSLDDWRFAKNISKTTTEITFPISTAPGTKVWFTACWFNSKMQNSPFSNPISTHLPGGGVINSPMLKAA